MRGVPQISLSEGDTPPRCTLFVGTTDEDAASDAGVMDGEMEGEVEMITMVVADCDA